MGDTFNNIHGATIINRGTPRAERVLRELTNYVRDHEDDHLDDEGKAIFVDLKSILEG